MAIPKIIHYVWLGHGKKNAFIQNCMKTWKQLGYEIKEWNEDNFDINYNKFTKQSYELKRYAFTSDVIRLYALYTEGGIYLDTDVSVHKPLDEFLNEPAFSGFEQPYFPVCATMGAEKGNPIIKEMLDYYNNRDFEEITNTIIMSNILEKHGIDRNKNEVQKIDNFTIYPQEYFNDENGYTKHHMAGSWVRKLTVIVPVYNQEELVLKALETIPKREDIEVIIINDGSIDNTLKICKQWSQTRNNVRIISYEENKGLWYAKNIAYDNANGEYINELDSDDYLYTEEYEKVLKELDGTDIVYMDLKINDGTVLKFDQTSKLKWGSGCARFIRRDFLGDTRCPEIKYAEDWYLSDELNKKSPTEKFTHIIGYHYNSPREGSMCDIAYKEMLKGGGNNDR